MRGYVVIANARAEYRIDIDLTSQGVDCGLHSSERWLYKVVEA
jgi:hypothetical protein